MKEQKSQESVNPLDKATLNIGEDPSLRNDTLENGSRFLDELKNEPFEANNSNISY